MGMPNGWFNDPDFSPDEFAGGLFGRRIGKDDEQSTTGLTEYDEVDWLIAADERESAERTIRNGADGSGETIVSIHRGDKIADQDDRGSIAGAIARHPSSNHTTDVARERERVDKAQHQDTGRVADGPTRFDQRSDDQGRANGRTNDAVKYAREQLARERGDERPGEGGEGVDNEGTPNFPRDTGIVHRRPTIYQSPTFNGCEFRATFQKLQTVGNGEWILQLKSWIDDSDEVKKLDKSQGLVLRITIERVPIGEQ